ncbi:uncharacterized protein LDX57_010862 [Aspergillus melleus]|uniref:uncharacterized protein n=1 Tax=Aspergillus melleus TaxID=138277 RepID=UPI001E8E1379|nr:uncharacterized protein LDX57_010862 [Aspergillus melleus]KAH8433228.1 hypothetical protein LDX57_010862 [Aspergillus melleus]
MVRRRSNKPKAVMARDRQFWSWAKISLPRDQKDDVISRLMDWLYAEGLLSVDMRPARVQAQVGETIARQIQLMPAAFRALHARRGAEMQRRLRLMVTARKRYFLAAKRGSPRRGGTSQRGQASGRGGRRVAQQQQQSQPQEDEQMEDEQVEYEQIGDEQMEEEQEFPYTGSAPCSDISSVTSDDEDAPPREPLSPVYHSSTPEEAGPMDVDLPAPATETPRRALGEPEVEILLPSPPNYYTPRSPVDSNAPDALRASPASPASPPPEEEPVGPSIITDEIQSTQPENLSAEVRSALRSGQLLEPYEPNGVGSPAPAPGTSRQQEDEISEVSTEPYTPPEDAMRKDLHPDEDYDDISAEASGEEVSGASQIEETPRETGQPSGDLAEEHPEEEHSGDEHPEDEHLEDEHPEEEHPEDDHPEEERHEEEQRQEAQLQHPLPRQPSEDDLPDYTSDDYEAEQQQRNPVTPQPQGQAGQVPSSSYSQEQFTQYRQSGYRSPSSGSTTEKDTTSEDSDDDRPSAHTPSAGSVLRGPGAVLRDVTIGTYDSFPEYPQDDEPQANAPSSAPALPGPNTALHDATIATYNSSFEDSHNDRTPARAPSTGPQLDDMNSFYDAAITVYAPENNSENTQFYISQIASPVPDPETRVPIENIRFDMFQEMLRPLNYDPERHEIYWKSTSNEEVVRAGSGVVAAMLVMNLRNLQRRFFLREKRS